MKSCHAMESNGLNFLRSWSVVTTVEIGRPVCPKAFSCSTPHLGFLRTWQQLEALPRGPGAAIGQVWVANREQIKLQKCDLNGP